MLINVCYKCASISISEGLTFSWLQSLFALVGLLFGVGIGVDVDIVTIVTKSLFSLLVALVLVLVLLVVVVYVKLFLLPNTLGLNLSFRWCCCFCCLWCCCCEDDDDDNVASPSSSCMQMVVDEVDFSLVVGWVVEFETISISARVDRWEEDDNPIGCVSKLEDIVGIWSLLLAIDSELSLLSIGDLLRTTSSVDEFPCACCCWWCWYWWCGCGCWWCRER